MREREANRAANQVGAPCCGTPIVTISEYNCERRVNEHVGYWNGSGADRGHDFRGWNAVGRRTRARRWGLACRRRQELCSTG